jgi:hypothetical protein
MTLDKERSAFLGRVTFAVVEKLGDDTTVIDADGKLRKWRTARVLDLRLIDIAADETAPRSINVYFQLEEQDMGSASGSRSSPSACSTRFVGPTRPRRLTSIWRSRRRSNACPRFGSTIAAACCSAN